MSELRGSEVCKLVYPLFVSPRGISIVLVDGSEVLLENHLAIGLLASCVSLAVLKLVVLEGIWVSGR